MTSGDVSVSSVEAKRDSGIRHLLHFTRSTFIQEAILGTPAYCAVDSRLLSVWREVLGDSAEVRFGKLSATVMWDDDAANNGAFGLFHLLNVSKLGWCGSVDEFAAKAKEEVSQKKLEVASK